jgi:Asp-tRNA(Asn)/Glu-tRNA(Gln) amidotransferase A subunit family amidase
VAAPAFLETLIGEPPLPPQIAFVRTPVWDKADTQTRAAFEGLVKLLGDSATVVDLPEAYAAAWDDQRAIMAADMAHNLGNVVERGGEASSKQLRDLLTEGSQVSAVRYLAAHASARRYAAGITEIFKQYDAILTPATIGVAPVGTATGNPAFCSLWSLTGMPAVSLPLLTGEGGMPLGVQLVGPAGDDARLLRTANWLVTKLDN